MNDKKTAQIREVIITYLSRVPRATGRHIHIAVRNKNKTLGASLTEEISTQINYLLAKGEIIAVRKVGNDMLYCINPYEE